MVKKALQEFIQRIGRYNKVINDYSRAAQSSPEPGIAYVNWGIDLAQAGKMDEALQKFEQAAAIACDRPEPFNNWGVALAKTGRLEEAIDKFSKAIAVDPSCADSYILWGAALLELGDLDGAQEKYEKAIQLNPANPEAYVNWGIALSRLGKYPEAIRHFQAALAIYNYQPQVYFLWGAVLAELKEYEAAIDKFKTTIRYMPKHAEAYYFWGIALNRLGQYEEAIEKSRKALELNPENPEIYLNMGDALANLGQYSLAIENYRQANLMDPDYSDIYLSWGIALCKLGNNEEGYQKFAKALEMDPDLLQVHYAWGSSLNENRRFHEALPHLKRVYEAQPEHIDSLINYGLAQIHTGAIDAGYHLLKEAEKYDPWNPQVHFLLGTQQLARGNAEKALNHLQCALETKKDFTDAAINLSLALCELGDTEEAVRTLRPFMRQHQESPEVNFFYGMILYRHGDYREAVNKFNKALSLRPQYSEALLGLAEIALKQDQPETACTHLKSLLEHHAEFIPALFLSGIAHAKLAESNDNNLYLLNTAKEYYRQTCQHDPYHLEAHINLAYMTGKLEDVDAMNQVFEELMNTPHFSKHTVLHYWAEALDKLGHADLAAQKREQATFKST